MTTLLDAYRKHRKESKKLIEKEKKRWLSESAEAKKKIPPKIRAWLPDDGRKHAR